MAVFNDTFYPTPPELGRRALSLFAKTLGSTSYLIDPSAGKGDLLDVVKNRYEQSYEKPHVYAVEIEPDLQAILESKGYPVLAADWLTYQPTLQFTHVLMNPPFATCEQHVLHAWDTLVAGEIVAILPAHALEGKDTFEQRLVRLLADHGQVVSAGQAFRHAENTTGVDVVLVHLTKKAARNDLDLEFDVQNTYRQTPVDEQAPAELRLNGFVASLDSVVKAAMAYQSEYSRAHSRMMHYLGEFRTYHPRKPSSQNDRPEDEKSEEFTLAHLADGDYNRFVSALMEAAWEKLFSHPGFQSILTARARKMMREYRQRQRQVDFNLHNVEAFLRRLVEMRDEILMAAVQDAFDTLTKNHPDNREGLEGWKSNEAWRVTRRLVLPYFIDHYYGYHVNWERKSEMDDIDRGLCVATGRRFETLIENKTTLYESLDRAIGGHTSPHQGQGESEFFTFRFYMRGTLHATFKDEWVWEKFNQVACGGRNWIAPAHDVKKSRSRPKPKAPPPIDQQGLF